MKKFYKQIKNQFKIGKNYRYGKLIGIKIESEDDQTIIAIYSIGRNMTEQYKFQLDKGKKKEIKN